MRRVLQVLCGAAITLAPALMAQQAGSGQPAGTGRSSNSSAQDFRPPAGSVVLHTNTQLVLVDVVVRDRNGSPVHGLTRDQFQVTEDKTPQTLRSFEEFSAHPGTQPADTTAAPGPLQPPGTFLVDKRVAEAGPLYVLLVDALNTPTTAQEYLRKQMEAYLQHTPPGAQFALFGLNGNLVFLQGFTSDRAVLLQAVKHMPNRFSAQLEDPNGTNEQPELLKTTRKHPGDLENVERTDRTETGFVLETRLRLTVDAFSTLGRYLSAFPGRKNLLWFSGSFPMNLIPDDGVRSSSQSVRNTETELRDMTNVLTRAEVALYPIDARGIVPSPTFDAGCHCGKYAGLHGSVALVKDTFTEDTQHGDEHNTMDTLADQTGGRAFYQTNDLAAVTAKAIDSGAHYYTLSYAPMNHSWNGQFRDIRVRLTGAAAAMNYTLSYRRGYYGTDPDRPLHGTEAAMARTAPPAEQQSDRKVAIALLHGAPAVSDLPFKVRILPASQPVENTVVAGNHLAPGIPAQGPFQRYSVDFLAPAQEFTLAPATDGQRSGEVRLMALVYGADGKLLNSTTGAVPLHLSPVAYTQSLQQGLPIHLEISVPVKRETFLRVALEDGPTNRMGVLEIAVADISHLSPAPEGVPLPATELAASPQPPSSTDVAASVSAELLPPGPTPGSHPAELASAAPTAPAIPAHSPQPGTIPAAPAPGTSAPGAPAPATPAPDMAADKPFTLHVYERLIQVPTLVLNSSQTSYRHLRPEGFWVQLDNGPAFHPRHVHVEADDPISLAVLLDVSGHQSGTLAQMLPMALAHLRPDLLSSVDHLSVFAYDCALIRSTDNAPASPEVLQAGLATALTSPQLHTGDGGAGTACGRSHPLVTTVSAVIANMRKMSGRRILLVISDRTDAGSPELLHNAWRFAADANVTVFGIRPAPYGFTPEALDEYRIRHRRQDAFADLCAHTGGLDFYSTSTNLAGSVNDLMGMVRDRYILEFQPPARGNAGEHEITVRILDNNAMIRVGTAVYTGGDAAGPADPNGLPADLSHAPVFGDRRPSANHP